MSRTHLLAATAACAALLVPSIAAAQPSGPPPPPPGSGPGYYGQGGYGGGYYAPAPAPTARRGFTFGFGVGLGAMNSDSNLTQCIDCDFDPIAVGFDFHLGGMLNPKTALLFEFWGQGQQIDQIGFNSLLQVMVMGAVQYWLSPQLWIKGGLGIANLSVQYNDGYYADSADIDSGTAIMGAIGYEVLHRSNFSLDLQLRLGAGAYDGIEEKVDTGMVNLGINWY